MGILPKSDRKGVACDARLDPPPPMAPYSAHGRRKRRPYVTPPSTGSGGRV